MNMKKAWLLGVVFLAAMVALAPSAAAQESAAKGSLNGTVVDSTQGAIVGAVVTLSGPTGSQVQTTNGSGIFIFQDLIPAAYKARVEMKGFRAAEVKDIQVNVGRVTAVRVQLEPGSVSQTVEVTTSAVTVDTTTSAVATNLSDDFYNRLPVQRGVAGLFYLAPGVVSGGGTGNANPSISGASGLENQYIADGVSITDTAFGGLGIYSRYYGSVGTGINLSFIKEVQVKTGAFQPQYGGATGGVVQIVTKSGSHDYHGAISGYWQPNAFEATRLNPDNFNLVNPFGTLVHNASADVSGEIGGSVPGMRDKLFFFGSMDPSETMTTDHAPALEGDSAFGNMTGRQLTYNYAAKLTYKLNDKHTLESSVFGDPTHSNTFPWARMTNGVTGIPNSTAFSKLNFGNRELVARYNGTLSPSWIVNLDVTWQHNSFTEGGFDNSVQRILDTTQTTCGPICGQQGAFTSVGRGFLENTQDDGYGANINTTKIVNFWGQHSVDIGYGYNRPFYKGTRTNTGPTSTPPTANQNGAALDFASFWMGQNANYNWTLEPFQNSNPANAATFCPSTICPLLAIPQNGTTVLTPVALVATRSEFGIGADGFKHFSSTGRNHSAYVNDSWTINKYLTLNAGIRWQQERLIGSPGQFTSTPFYTFTDNWSPRIGVDVDPLGDRKNKIFFNFGRYNYNLPLDLAERSLTNETDLAFLTVAPQYTTGAGGVRTAVINQFGTVNPVVANTNVLNEVGGSPFSGTDVFPSFSSEPIHSGTKLTYEDEYVFGAEHEFSHGVVVTARYIHRSLRRIVEDTGGISPESNKAGILQNFAITNPSKNLDIFTNPQQQDFAATLDPTGKFFTNASAIPASCLIPGSPTTGTIPTSDVPFFSGILVNSLNVPVTDGSGNNAACENVTLVKGVPTALGVNGQAAGSPIPDGIPDGFPDPVHKYWAVEFEVNKSFSHNWQLRTNYRISKVFGNFEGAFRNDNGQSDPGISSLFDFTSGNFGLLGGQFTPGILNQDRQQVANGFFSYVFDHGMLKNLTLGTGASVSTGTPITELAAHPIYLNSGEVPIAGRGNEGRTPTTGYVNFHGDYVMNLTERMHLRFGVDLFNIANTKRILYFNQNVDLQFGVPNVDFLKPSLITGTTPNTSSGTQSPFNARVFFRLEF
jgi:hypothetical protein